MKCGEREPKIVNVIETLPVLPQTRGKISMYFILPCPRQFFFFCVCVCVYVCVCVHVCVCAQARAQADETLHDDFDEAGLHIASPEPMLKYITCSSGLNPGKTWGWG